MGLCLLRTVSENFCETSLSEAIQNNRPRVAQLGTCFLRNNRSNSPNNSQMWIYALGVTLRETLRTTIHHSPPPASDIIMDNQRQTVISQLHLKEDYYQSDRQRTTGSSGRSNDGRDINCRPPTQQLQKRKTSDAKTNTHGN